MRAEETIVQITIVTTVGEHSFDTIGTIANLGHTIQHETHYEMVAENE